MKKQLINEVERFQKIAGIKKEGYMGTPYDSSEDMVNKRIKEDANIQGRTSYDLVKGPNEDPLVKRILVNLHNKYGKEGYHYDPYMNRLTIHGEANEDGAVVDMLSALFDQPEYQDLSEDDYSEDPSSDMDDESQSGDTDVMGIDEAEPRKKGTLDQKEKIIEKLQFAIEDYLEDIGLKELSKEERPKFQKGLGFTQTTPSDTFFNKSGIQFHATAPDDDPRRSDPRHNDQEAVYGLRIYKPNERFNLSTLRSLIQQAKREAKTEGFQFYDKVRRSNQDILCSVTIR